MVRLMELVKEGKISTPDQLKRVFRKLAKKYHPDGTLSDEESFKKLKAEYDEAAAWLASAGGSYSRERAGNLVFSRQRCMRAFADLVASNFPADPGVKKSVRGYQNIRRTFVQEYSLLDPEAGKRIITFEKELYRIRGDTIVWNPLFGKMKMLFYNIGSFHYTGSPFSRQACKKWLDEAEKDLLAAGCPITYDVLTFFVEDMDKGPAI